MLRHVRRNMHHGILFDRCLGSPFDEKNHLALARQCKIYK